jgi:hypothetical protein
MQNTTTGGWAKDRVMTIHSTVMLASDACPLVKAVFADLNSVLASTNGTMNGLAVREGLALCDRRGGTVNISGIVTDQVCVREKLGDSLLHSSLSSVSWGLSSVLKAMAALFNTARDDYPLVTNIKGLSVRWERNEHGRREETAGARERESGRERACTVSHLIYHLDSHPGPTQSPSFKLGAFASSEKREGNGPHVHHRTCS